MNLKTEAAIVGNKIKLVCNRINEEDLLEVWDESGEDFSHIYRDKRENSVRMVTLFILIFLAEKFYGELGHLLNQLNM